MAGEEVAGQTAEHGGNILTKRIGPLPVIGWVVVIIGAYLVYRYIHNLNASNATPSGTATDNAPIGSTDTGSGQTPGPTPQPAMTNAQWYAKAYAGVIRLGYSPQLAKTALDRYFSGEQLDAREEAVIHAAINLYGAPPVSGNFGQEAPPSHDHGKPPKKRRHTRLPFLGTLESTAHQD